MAQIKQVGSFIKTGNQVSKAMTRGNEALLAELICRRCVKGEFLVAEEFGEGEACAVEKTFVGKFELGDYGQRHKGHRHERCNEGTAQFGCLGFDSEMTLGNAFGIEVAHQTGDGQRKRDGMLSVGGRDAALAGNEMVDGNGEGVVVTADGDDVVAVVGYG